MLLLSLTGCAEPAQEGPTYYGDVQPILAANCTGCHADDGIAAFALDTYERSSPLAEQIAKVTADRTMPPFLADNSGTCGTFRDARWLAQEEIDLLARWAGAGAPAGEPRPATTAEELPKLAGDVRTIATESYVPSTAQPDDYRCFLTEVVASEETFYVTGFDVRPGNPRLAHHMIAFYPRNAEEAAAAQALDDAEEGPGYSCFGGAGVQATAAAAWAPGGGATFFPDGTGVELKGGRPFIIQMHYNTLSGDTTPDRTEVDLQVATGGVTPGRFVPLADTALTLPPLVEAATWETSRRVADYGAIATSFQIRGVFPHMHTLGRALTVEVEHADGTRTCVVDVPRWNFHWQMLYFHEGPGIGVDTDDTLRIRCTFDTRSRTETTVWGEGTQDEMCVAGLFITL